MISVPVVDQEPDSLKGGPDCSGPPKPVRDPLHQSKSPREKPASASNNRTWVLVVVGSAILIALWLTVGAGIGRHPSATTAHNAHISSVPPSAASSINLNVVPVPSPAAASPKGSANGPPPATGAWSLAFDDEFNGSRLNSSLWSSCYDWGCVNTGNPESEWYQAQNISVKGGNAIITSKVQGAHGKPYTSDLIQTNGHFSFRYGYAAIRVHLPSGTGSWPAFWMLPTNLSFPPEIDIFESWGTHLSTIMSGVHYANNGDANILVRVPALHSGYHTFAVDWEPHSLAWYVDGVKTYSLTLSISSTMYLIANVAQLKTPAVNGDSGYPSTMSVDYVRVWQHS